MGEKYGRVSGDQKCNAGSVPTVFVGELVRANAKGMSVVETARALAWKGVRQRVVSADAVQGFLFGQTSCRKRRRDSHKVSAHSSDVI